MEKKVKAIALLSGGLDSVLAIALLLRQNVEVIALLIRTGFTDHKEIAPDGKHRVSDIAGKLGIPLRVKDIHEEYWDTLLHPRYGYGKHMNPCLDCHIHMIRVAADVMREEQADLVVTGEVLGQRPNSQLSHQMKIAVRESGIEGRLLRPLSALHLPPTIPEEEGRIDRSALKDFRGRSRRPQLDLARELGVEELAVAAGGNCFLTNDSFSRRMKDWLKHFGESGFPRDDIGLLRIGRHFRLSASAYLIVSRDEAEAGLLESYRQRHCFFDLTNVTGASAVGLGRFSETDLQLAASILGRYSKAEENRTVRVSVSDNGQHRELFATALENDDPMLERLRLS
jgi:tRNA-uridine 2-sulfurtransferase